MTTPTPSRSTTTSRCWYLNKRRVIELVGADTVLPPLGPGSRLPDDQLRRNSELSVLKHALLGWLRAAKPPTLGELVVSGKLRENSIFTCYTNFIFKGLLELHPSRSRRKSATAMATAHAKLDELRPGLRLVVPFHPEHLTANSSWSQLSGQKRVLVLGVVTGIDGDTIHAVPWVIANPFPHLGQASVVGNHWSTKLDLEPLKGISESDIKVAFAQILGEPTVPKDWGGERSDLFSDRVEIEEERIATAFIFKGPAKFEPLTLASDTTPFACCGRTSSVALRDRATETQSRKGVDPQLSCRESFIPADPPRLSLSLPSGTWTLKQHPRFVKFKQKMSEGQSAENYFLEQPTALSCPFTAPS